MTYQGVYALSNVESDRDRVSDREPLIDLNFLRNRRNLVKIIAIWNAMITANC